MDLISALGLSTASGLNAYIPMVVLGLTDRLTTAVDLPQPWSWLSSTPALIILSVLLGIELVADKLPAVDTVNDVIQTLIRPTSGGIVFATSMGEEQTITSFSTFPWIPFIVGFVIALLMHGLKATARPAANMTTAGFAAPALSVGGDLFSLTMSLFAIFIPVLVIILVGLIIYALIKFRKALKIPSRRPIER